MLGMSGWVTVMVVVMYLETARSLTLPGVWLSDFCFTDSDILPWKLEALIIVIKMDKLYRKIHLNFDIHYIFRVIHLTFLLNL